MIMRLWWKDARQFWPIAAVLVVFGGVIQAFVVQYGGEEARRGSLVYLAFVWTGLYAFAVTAAAFAGERESGTLRLLDSFAVGRWRLWGAKTAFAFATTTLLALVMLGIAAINTSKFGVDRHGPAVILGIGALVLLEVLGWGMFFSSLLKNALSAAVLAIICVTFATPMLRRDGAFTIENEIHGAPLRLAVALTTLAASALILTRSGPPVRSSGASRAIERSFAPVDAKPARPRFSRHAVRSLVWETVSSSDRLWWFCLGFALVYSLSCLILWGASGAWPPMILANLFLGLFAGVSVFNAEHRSRTRLFLAQHGVRPGLIWMVKLGVWLGTLALFLWLPTMIYAAIWQYAGPGREAQALINLPVGAAALLSGGFAIGQFCGMTIRRGITAFTAAIMLFIVFVIPITALSGVNMISPLFVGLIAFALLFITWAWSGDWLLDPPGAGKWVRLGALVTTTSAAWFVGYTADRAWGVPRLSPVSETALAKLTAPALQPVHADDNAAELYRQAGAKLDNRGSYMEDSQAWYNQINRVIREGWDPKAKRAITWLNANTEALKLTREAAKKPACQFMPLDRVGVSDQRRNFPNVHLLADLVAISAREKLARGDLAGSWSDIVTLFHMAGHCTGPVPPILESSGLTIERDALRLAMQWAADPAQTSKSLREALQTYQDMPTPSIGESLAAESLMIRNSLARPRADVLAEVTALYWGDRKDRDQNNPLHTLAIQAMTTPWEVERARRQSEQIASEVIGHALNDPRNRPGEINPFGRRRAGRFARPQYEPVTVALEQVTPLLKLLGASPWDRVITMNDRNEVARRALPMILMLRMYQTEHDGKLPIALNIFGSPTFHHIAIDPYSGAAFGYLRSDGRSLLPLGNFEPHTSWPGQQPQTLAPTNDCMLLYSIGPDAQNDYARFNDEWGDERGDIIFPIRDNVPPPTTREKPPGDK